MPESPLSDGARERPLPEILSEALKREETVTCSDCGHEVPRRLLRDHNFVYGSWVCSSCILSGDEYK